MPHALTCATFPRPLSQGLLPPAAAAHAALCALLAQVAAGGAAGEGGCRPVGLPCPVGLAWLFQTRRGRLVCSPGCAQHLSLITRDRALLQGLDWAQANDEQARKIALAGQELVKK
jgi:hypothetical protein